MITHDPETLLNAAVCAVIALRLFLFRRDGGEYVRWGAYLAYGLILAAGSVTIRTLMGAYEGTTDPAELFINVVLCIQVIRAKGNVVQMFKGASQKLIKRSGGND
ncbi:phage holin family protein [Yersinia intermedia]|uniref:phage holin family protein n=1 Tax=Yersinia intermedia TaxID=631 RepID=UPI0022FE7EF1|nr:phage holin family protein [Yersinia intermedia]MDA5480859.1 phage holin family protein [Yersinia intermedia]